MKIENIKNRPLMDVVSDGYLASSYAAATLMERRRLTHLSSALLLLSLAASNACATPLPEARGATADSNTAAALTPEQQKAVGPLAEKYLTAHPEALTDALGQGIATYLVAHPEFLMAAAESMRQQQEVAQRQAMGMAAVKLAPALLDAASPSAGPSDAKVAVIMFFDYQCVYCGKAAPVVEALIKANPTVRFVFKEFPIFAPRWPVSGYAARVGEAIWKAKGAKAYLAYHNGMFATGKVEGQMTMADVKAAAKSSLDDAQLAQLEKNDETRPEAQAVAANLRVGEQMQISGTPTFVVLPQQGATTANTTVLPGATSQDTLTQAIAKAASEAKLAP